ncbi:MAG: non-canonical purine NTP diphosphatase [Bacteroidota bacterium]
MKLVFATNNLHKVHEINTLVGDYVTLLSLKDIGCDVDLPEEKDTLEGNAYQKAKYVFDHYGLNCFADDTGLEVDALDGLPGVYSARYAGNAKNPMDNINKLLREMKDKQNRKARFRTVISLIINDTEKRFEGIVDGEIIDDLRGEKGFGYDPVFKPDGYEITFAEMPLDEKNNISHRSKAIKKLTNYLMTNYTF